MHSVYQPTRLTQPSIPPWAVKWGPALTGKAKAWSIQLADRPVGVQVKLWKPSQLMRALPTNRCYNKCLHNCPFYLYKVNKDSDGLMEPRTKTRDGEMQKWMPESESEYNAFCHFFPSPKSFILEADSEKHRSNEIKIWSTVNITAATWCRLLKRSASAWPELIIACDVRRRGEWLQLATTAASLHGLWAFCPHIPRI